MLLGPAILILATGATAPAPTKAAPAPEPSAEPAPAPAAADAEEDPCDGDDYSEPCILKKRSIPSPPSQNRKAYLAWKKKLPKATQKKLDRLCREYGGMYLEACNGIGPYAIPRPPSRIAMPRPKSAAPDTALGMTQTHEQWQASLSTVQNRYYQEYCRWDANMTEEQQAIAEGNQYSDLCGATPIVLAFGGERVEYAAGSDLDWPTATTPWLAVDVDGDGAITSSAELFGSDTLLPGGGRADNGFTALAPLDANRDGVLDAQDPAFASLVIWADRDGDRQSSPGELTKLATRITSIRLANQRIPYCDVRGNCEGERSTFTWRDELGTSHEGAAIDVYLKFR